jgi:hypothetical protein
MLDGEDTNISITLEYKGKRLEIPIKTDEVFGEFESFFDNLGSSIDESF